MANKGKTSNIQLAATAARKASRDAEIASGIKPRAVTFQDRRAVARKGACRGPWASMDHRA